MSNAPNLTEKRNVAIVFFIAFAICAMTTKTYIGYAGNEAGRFAMIESIVERGTFAIDGSPFAWTTDKVKIDGRFYCDKPPLMPMAGAFEALILKIFGIDFISHPKLWIYLLTLFSVGICSAWLAAMAYADSHRLWKIEARASRFFYTAAVWAGTIAFSYSGTYTNHVPAAAFLYAAFGKFFRLNSSPNGPKNNSDYFIFGLLAALTWAMDYIAGAVFIAAFGIAIVAEWFKNKKGFHAVLLYASGLLPPVFVSILLNYMMVGDVRPLYLIPGAYDFEGSAFIGGGVAGTFSPSHPLTYAFHVFFGYRSIFLHSPILVPAMIFAVGFIARKNSKHKTVALSTVTAFLFCALIYIATTNNYGGWAYGFRYLAPAMPLCAAFAGAGMAGVGKKYEKIIWATLAFSILLAALGNYNPWTPCGEGERKNPGPASKINSPILGNILLAEATLMNAHPAKNHITINVFGGNEAAAAKYLAIAFINRNDFSRAEKILDAEKIRNPNDPTVNILLNEIEKVKIHP